MELLYMDDSYIRDFQAKVISAVGRQVILDRTAFFPAGGGVDCDHGIIIRKNEEFKVISVKKADGLVVHEVEREGISKGDSVNCLLDWERRYKLMRYHTGTHVLCGVFSREHNLLVTGNQLTTDKARVDLNMEHMDIPLIQKCFARANEIIQKDLPVQIYYKSREEAEKDPSLFKLAIGFPYNISTLRIVDIKGFDAQADGGCHVKSLKEIGKLVFQEAVNKGKNNRRVYYTVE